METIVKRDRIVGWTFSAPLAPGSSGPRRRFRGGLRAASVELAAQDVEYAVALRPTAGGGFGNGVVVDLLGGLLIPGVQDGADVVASDLRSLALGACDGYSGGRDAGQPGQPEDLPGFHNEGFLS